MHSYSFIILRHFPDHFSEFESLIEDMILLDDELMAKAATILGMILTMELFIEEDVEEEIKDTA